MADFTTTKVNGNTVADSEWNQLADIDNSISSTGQAPSTGDLNQLGKAMANYAAISTFYTDSGIADAYVLTPIGSFQAPHAYTNGMEIRFRAGNANTGGAATVSVNSLGVKNLKKPDGTTDLAAGEISTTQDSIFRYNGTSFVLATYVQNSTNQIKGISFFNKQIIISNNNSDSNNDIDFAAGNFIFSDYSGQAILSAITKRLDASWVAGTNQGGLFSGVKANSTWYHCFAIYNPTTSTVDAGFDTSVNAANIPSGYTKYKRVGSIRTNGSGNIINFNQFQNRFEFKVSIQDASNVSLPTGTGSLATITTPLDIITSPLGTFMCQSDTGDFDVLVQSGNQTPTNASGSLFNAKPTLVSQDNYVSVALSNFTTNTSSQIRVASVSGNGTYFINTTGWIDITL